MPIEYDIIYLLLIKIIYPSPPPPKKKKKCFKDVFYHTWKGQQGHQQKQLEICISSREAGLHTKRLHQDHNENYSYNLLLTV